MITAAWAATRLWFSGLPDGARRAALWIALALLTIALMWWFFRQHDAKVIERHEDKREAAANDARGRSAEERADDAIAGIIAEQARETEIAKAAASEAAKAPEARAALPPTTIALNCQRLRQSYTAAELKNISAYQEKCR